MEAATTSHGSRKEYRFNRLTPFTGDRTLIENFVQECNVYLNINHETYNNEPAKVAFALSFLTAGEAQKWKEQFICSITKDRKMTFPTYADFMTKLQAAFKAVNPVDTAMQKLALLRQGNRPVETMITEFWLLVGDAGLSVDSASDQIHLIKMFMNCLNLQLKKKIIFGDSVPRTIEGWYEKATQYDSNFQLAQAMMALDNQPTQKNTGRTWNNQNQNKDPNTMDIGATTNGTTVISALTEEMCTTLMKIGACFRCRKNRPSLS